LVVWGRAHAFAVRIRRFARGLPRTGYSDLKSQLTRAAESISTNLVEGCGAATRKEFARFIDISIKSASEVDYLLQVVKDYGLVSVETWRALSDEVTEIRKMLYGLRRAILAADAGSRA